MKNYLQGDQVKIYHPDTGELISVTIEYVNVEDESFDYTTPDGEKKYAYFDEIQEKHYVW